MAGSGLNAFAHVGDGGGGAVGNFTGEICVHAGTTVTLNANTGGTSDLAFTMIGHGGENADGAHSGNVTVLSGLVGAGGILVRGGDAGTGRFAQIGHGGRNASGNLTANISVVSQGGGDLDVLGGAGTDAYAMVGLGALNTSGTRTGGLQVYVEGATTVADGTGTNAGATLWHQTTSAITSIDTPVYKVLSLGGLDLNSSRFSSLNGVLDQTNVTLATGAGADLDLRGSSLAYNSAFAFNAMAGGNLTVNLSVQNAGSGGVNLIAGWDGTTGRPVNLLDLTVVCDPIVGDLAGNGGGCHGVGRGKVDL